MSRLNSQKASQQRGDEAASVEAQDQQENALLAPQEPITRRSFLAATGVLLMGASMLLSGCVDQHQTTYDEEGNEVERLIGTSPAVCEICDQLDLDLIGVPTSDNLPERYEGVTEVGTSMSPDMEIVKSLNPSYVISPNTLLEDLQPKYAAISVASIFLDLRSVPGLYESISYLGQKFDRVDIARELNAEYEEYIAEFNASHEGMEGPSVLVLMGLPGSYLVATENSYVGSLVDLAGGTNVYEDSSEQDFVSVNTEDMVTRDPDIILRTAHTLPTLVMAMFAEEFETNDIWKHFRAVQNDRVYDLDYDLFGMSAKFNYPEALEDLYEIFYEYDEDAADDEDADEDDEDAEDADEESSESEDEDSASETEDDADDETDEDEEAAEA